jgi:predicted PhzF superfamily epimerase YddE/YHI9
VRDCERRLCDSEQVAATENDFARLREFASRGVVVTSRSADPAFDFVSRYVAPAFGIDEDPVTGSTHFALAPFWSRRLQKQTFTARQVSERGGLLRVVDGNRVRLGGQAVTCSEASCSREDWGFSGASC